MRRLIAFSVLSALTLIMAMAASTVGSGPYPSPITQSFITAYNRGNFAAVTVSPPIADVHSLVSPALVQEFTSKTDNTVKYALIMPDFTAATLATWQVYSDIYTYYTSLGAATVGVPSMDTTACPITYFGTCDYQLFTKDYALFAYSNPANTNISVKDPYYTVWSAAGGIVGAFGPATSATATGTSTISAIAGTQQNFATGAVFSYPNSSTTPGVYGLSGAFYSAYNNSSGTSTLGFPTSAAAVVNTTTGMVQQNFEGGKIQQVPGSDPVVVYPLGQVNILNAGQGLSLAPGASATVSALTLDSQQNVVTGRVLNWSTSNGAIATVQGNGYTATVTGGASGAANIYVTGEGKTSPPLVVTVGSGCCAIGQGAPTQAITSAFLAAAARNALPAAATANGTVVRSGAGYIQILDGSGSTYVISQADSSGTAYVIGGTFYTAYLAGGGFTGPLGYPASDLLPGNVQKFVSGALLTGVPPLVVPSQIAPKWLQNQTAAGPPSSPAQSFASYTGAGGLAQTFGGGVIYSMTVGSQAGQAFFSTGAVLARYLVLLGPAGAMGAPTTDIYNNLGVLTENFEGGYIDQQPGAATAVEHFNPRHPSLSVMPPAVAPGGKVHISATGFAPGASLAFTLTGQPNFTVPAPAGAFSWDVVVPATAKPASVSIAVSDTGSKDAASGSYSIVQPAALLPTLSIASGDLQTGYPSSLLPLSIVAVLVDSSGNPVPNIPIALSTSPGASATGPATTDSQGKAVISMRLPAQAGVATGSISAAGQVATFSALATTGSLPAYPALAASGQSTTLLASIASALLFYQNNGILPASAGAANTGALTQYLTAQSGYAVSDTGDSILNPWVAARFASGALTIAVATQNQIRDLIAAGNSPIVNLNLTVDGKAAGGASVDAIGIASDGSILIADPNPATAQTSLNAYLTGFQAQGHSYVATIASVLSIAPSSTVVAAAPFTVAAPFTAGSAIASAAGSCPSLDLAGATAPGGVRFQYCDGSASLYELDFASPAGATLLDLSGGPSLQIPANTTTRWNISRKNGALTAVPAVLSITGVTDSAAFASSLAPNQLFTIFGTGFVAKGLTVTLGGKAVSVLSVSPFQINAAIPAGTAVTASSPLVVTSGGASVSTTVAIAATAPGIFVVGSLGAILNSDATLNSPANPAQRGQYVSIYCTGLGATTASGGLQIAVTAPSVIVNGQSIKPLYAGAVTGFVGLYQVNVTIPATVLPGPATLMLTQGKTSSNTVPLAVD